MERMYLFFLIIFLFFILFNLFLVGRLVLFGFYAYLKLITDFKMHILECGLNLSEYESHDKAYYKQSCGNEYNVNYLLFKGSKLLVFASTAQFA